MQNDLACGVPQCGGHGKRMGCNKKEQKIIIQS